MVRGKKTEKVLTPEEKLEQALVPVEEQPYPVPENWCWTQMRWVIESSKEKTEDFSIPGVRYIGLEHIEKDTGITGYASTDGIKSLKNIFHSGQILYGKLRPYLNKHDIATFDGVCSTDILVFNSRKTTLPQYINYYFNHRDFIEYTVANSKGINLPRVSEDTVLGALCPLPPLAEQQRIVDRIESLFTKLDEAKEKVQAVLDGFETRKAVILHKAFAGELTAKWRKENNIALDSWCWKTIDEVCFDIKVGIVIKPSQYYTDNIHGAPAFRSANVRENYVDNFDWVYLNDEGMKANHRSIVHTGDVLIVRSGNPGTACVVTEEFDGYNAIDILIAVPNPEIVLPEYLCLFTNSPLGKKTIAEGKRGMALAHFNVKSYSKVDICLPMLNEQKEIIDLFQRLLLNEQEVKKTTESVLDQIETMKKSILARAFRGELGTNDLSEECMVKLLENML